MSDLQAYEPERPNPTVLQPAATQDTSVEEVPLETGAAAEISEEDREEIAAQIERVISESRIAVDESAPIQAAKSGVTFPVLVNLILLLILAGGIAAFSFLQDRGERTAFTGSGAVTGAEGRLLEELRRESEEQLQAKAQEIAQIQQNLAQIQEEREQLEASITERIARQEQDLRAQLEAELEAERQRLRSQGVSEEDIQRRIAELEAERSAFYEGRLAEYRAELEAERARREASLQALQSEYNQSLSTLNEERERLLAEAAEREAELQAEMDARARALEEERTTIERQLADLAEQNEREELVEQQLIGFYDTVKEDIQAGDLDGALGTLGSIRSYLNEDGIADLPAVLQRREIEFFVIDSLSSLVENQRQRAQPDVNSLVAQAELITSVKEIVLQADEAVSLGNLDQAEELYSEALAIVPDISRSYAFLEEQRASRERERRARLDATLARAESTFLAGEYRQSLELYAEAMTYLPRTAEQNAETVERIATAGYTVGIQQDSVAATNQAQPPFDQAQSLLEDGLYAQAAAGFLDVLARFPRSNQAADAIRGIDAAVEGLQGSTADQTAALRLQLEQRIERVQELEAELAARQARLEEAEQQLSRLQEELTGLREETIPELNAAIALYEERQAELSEVIGEGGQELETLRDRREELLQENEGLREALAEVQAGSGEELRALQAENARLEQEKTELIEERDTLAANIDLLNAEIGALRQEVAAMREADQADTDEPEQPAVISDAEVREEMERLLRIEEAFESLRRSYRRYAQNEDRILASEGQTGLLESKLYLDEFLTSEVIEETFPGLWGRIKTYDRAFENVGRRVAVQDLTDTIYQLSLYDTREERLSFLSRQIDASRDDRNMVQLLEELRDLVDG